MEDDRRSAGRRRKHRTLSDELLLLGLLYVMDVQASMTVWPPGAMPLPPKPWTGKGRKPKALRRDDEHKPISVKALGMTLANHPLRKLTVAQAYRYGMSQ
jgi:hypothetical protein